MGRPAALALNADCTRSWLVTLKAPGGWGDASAALRDGALLAGAAGY